MLACSYTICYTFCYVCLVVEDLIYIVVYEFVTRSGKCRDARSGNVVTPSGNVVTRSGNVVTRSGNVVTRSANHICIIS